MPLNDTAGRDAPACPIEAIVAAYLETAHGDAGLALRCAVTDAVSDLMAGERRARKRSRVISRGFERGRPDDG